ncbi:MBL fold metallo-hydrolase [Aquipuribacter nitratireducens]|uniref:MBL fold metallo-hydrolase n=1 Tax=Aquipuribacter nitratireducens TaxID=650104 RepID=A0ABW0GQM1_9MICO
MTGEPRLVRADNPGPMTLEGTNTCLLGAERVLVVDPGPADDAHVAAVLAAAGDALAGVLLTHRHPDHAEALGHPLLRDALAAAGGTVLAADPALGSAPDADRLGAATDEPVELLAVPGHTDDSVALVLPRRRAVLTGDTVLGRGTSVVAHPDGDLTDYLTSLAALRARVGGDGSWRGLPGHGPVLPDLVRALGDLLAHRHARVEQVRTALTALGDDLDDDLDGDALVDAVVARVYPEVTDPVLVHAAGRTVRATLVHLARPATA